MDNPNKLEHIFQFLCQSVRLGSIQSEMSNSPQYAINPFCFQSFHTASYRDRQSPRHNLTNEPLPTPISRLSVFLLWWTFYNWYPLQKITSVKLMTTLQMGKRINFLRSDMKFAKKASGFWQVSKLQVFKWFEENEWSTTLNLSRKFLARSWQTHLTPIISN